MLLFYYRIEARIPISKEVEPLLEIDRNVRKLEASLGSKAANNTMLNIGDVKKFLPCTINLDPYLRKLIRGKALQNTMLNKGDVKMFLPCTINLDPYLRKLIRGKANTMLNIGDVKKFLPCTINLDSYLRKLNRGDFIEKRKVFYEALCPSHNKV